MNRREPTQGLSRDVPQPSLKSSIASSLQRAAPAGGDMIEWMVDAAGMERSEAAAVLAGEMDLSVDAADEVLSACTGASLVDLVRSLPIQP